jgi:hypothetical protein
MAQAPERKKYRLSPEAQGSLLSFGRAIRTAHSQYTDLVNKLEVIDKAYTRYRGTQNRGDGVDVAAGSTICSTSESKITLPITVSQVDSYVGYLADIFCSGYPIFPVVSPPLKRKEAEGLQSIIDDHAMRGRYVRQMMMNMFDAVKYDLSACELDWCPLDTYAIPDAYSSLTDGRNGAQKSVFSINKMNRISPYNLIMDRRVAPVDVPYMGEYAGYVEAISGIELERRINYYNYTGNAYNTNSARKAGIDPISGVGFYVLGCYREIPQVSNTLVAPNLRTAGLVDWGHYLTGVPDFKGGRPNYYSSMYESVTLYVRIIPKNHKIYNEEGSLPQVWKLVILNDEILIYAARIYSVYDTLPIYISQPREDGLGLQSISVGEGAIDFQETASQLFQIRINSARRAIMDRAIYDPTMINPSHLSGGSVSPKIPLRDRSQSAGRTIEDAYKQIPFDSRGTETVIQDVGTLLKMADNLNGTNQPFQGQFQKGNKTRKEWTDTMEGATNRLRLSALAMEYQFFLPIKEQIKLNIFQYGATGPYQNAQTGSMVEVTPELLDSIRKNIQAFQLADGFHPAEKLASTDVLSAGMQLMMNSPVLAAQLGPALPQIWAHLMSLGGVKGIDQYLPQAPTGAPATPSGLPAPATQAAPEGGEQQ